jgi:hypothetical protein
VPALPNVAKTVRLSVVHSFLTNPDVVSRFYIAYSGAVPSQTDLQVLVDNTVAAWAANLIGLVNDHAALERVDGVDLNSATGAEATLADHVTGTRVGDPLLPSAAAVVSYHISRRYRGGHPRGYWPFGVETDTDAGPDWQGAFVTDAQTAIDGFFVDVLAGGWGGAGTLTHVNVSYYEGFTVVTDPVTGRARNRPDPRAAPLKDLITANIVRIRPGTQRRRLSR